MRSETSCSRPSSTRPSNSPRPRGRRTDRHVRAQVGRGTGISGTRKGGDVPMTRRASLPGVDELFRSQKERPEDPQVAEAPSLQVAKDPEPKAEPEPDRAGGTLEDVRIFEEL